MDKLSWSSLLRPLNKHVSSISFTPVMLMRPGDWKVLDFPALRPRARSRIAGSIVKGQLAGFFEVDYDMHKRVHGGKPKYYWPADEQTARQFNDGLWTPERFEDFSDYDEEPEAEYPDFDRQLGKLTVKVNLLPLATAVLLSTLFSEEQERVLDPIEYGEYDEYALALTDLWALYTADEEDFISLANDVGVDYTGNRTETIEAIIDELESYLDKAEDERSGRVSGGDSE